MFSFSSSLNAFYFIIFKAIFGSDLFVISESSHMVMMEKPKEVNYLLELLLRGNDDNGVPVENGEDATTAADNLDSVTQYIQGSQHSLNTLSSPRLQDSQANRKTSSNSERLEENQNTVATNAESSTPTKHENKILTLQHSAVNSPAKTNNRNDLKSAKSIPARLFSAKR